MSGDICAPIKTFSADNATQRPKNLHHCSRRFGLLVSIQPAQDCQMALIVNRFGEHLVVLPQDLDLSGYVGKRMGLTRIDNEYHVRGLSA